MSEKSRLQPWRTERFCIPEKDRARFVAHRESILDASHEPYDDAHPLIGMDEAARQIVSDVEPALPVTPGQPRREDHHDQREGVQAVFAFVDPLPGWRRVTHRDSRPRRDRAEEVRQLLDVDDPHAERVTLVCDNLHTHDIARLDTRFDAATAHRLARRRRIVDTPRNGSGLAAVGWRQWNECGAEIEGSVLTRPCLGRRFDSVAERGQAITAWQNRRNTARCGTRWRFTTADAGIKLHALDPAPDELG